MACWIFQGNPGRFDIDGYIAANNPVKWLVSQHIDRVEDGDTVYLYRCKGKGVRDGGIVAKGRVLGMPFKTKDHTASSSFWKDPSEASHERPRVWLLLEWTHDGSGSLSRTALMADEVTAKLPNLPAAQQTNFRLPDGLAARLDELAASHKTQRASVRATPSSSRGTLT
jgi:hypothetical protein